MLLFAQPLPLLLLLPSLLLSSLLAPDPPLLLSLLTLLLPLLLLSSLAPTVSSRCRPGPVAPSRPWGQRPRGLPNRYAGVVQPAPQPLELAPSLSTKAWPDSAASSELRRERTWPTYSVRTQLLGAM